MPHAALDGYIQGYFRQIGAQQLSGEARAAVGALLTILIEHGMGGKTHRELYGDAAAVIGMPVETLRRDIAPYIKVFRSVESPELLDDIFLHGARTLCTATVFDILRFSAGYIRRTARQDGYVGPDNLRYRSVAFTGHRPKNLPEGFSYDLLGKVLTEKIRRMISQGYEQFYVGMCPGVDLYAGKCVLDLKPEYPHIRLYAAITFEGHGAGQEPFWQALYEKILEGADERIIVSTVKGNAGVTRCSRFMVDHADVLLAVLDEQVYGGTVETVMYARSSGVETMVVDPRRG